MHRDADARRRRLVALLVTAVLFVAAVVARVVLAPTHARLLGLSVDRALEVVGYVLALGVGAAAVAWIRSLPRHTPHITVRDLRRRAGYHR